MTNPTPEQVEAALKYGRGSWNFEDLRDLYDSKTYHFSQIPDKACRILAGVVDRLRARATRLEKENIRLFKELQKLKSKQP